MPKVIRNPRIHDNIKLIDYKQYRDSTAERQTELMQWYENGDLLVLTQYRFDAGRDVLSTMTFPNKRGTAKIILHTAGCDHGEPPREREWTIVNQELLEGKPERIATFHNAVAAANGELIRLVDCLFPRYRYTKRLCIYNLSEMLAHNLHFDSPQHADTSTQLRAFVNLDNFPRIWYVSERLEDVARQNYEAARANETITQHPREFTRSMTQAAFGDRFNSGSNGYPKHSIAFRPGEVWFLNPNMTAHEVVYGRRLLDGVFLFDKEDLLDKERFFPTIVERLHKQLGSQETTPDQQ